MFENLDAIDWASFGTHIEASQQSSKIPYYIRQLLSEDHDKRVIAIGYLFGHGQDFGRPDDATPFIIPFVFEVLELEEYAEKVLLLEALVIICDVIPQREISYLRRTIAIYDVIEGSFPLLVKLLNNENEDIRAESITLLSCIQEKFDEVLDILKAQYESETSTENRIHILDCIVSMIRDTRKIGLKETQVHIDFIKSVVRDSNHVAERLAASIELVYLPAAFYLRGENEIVKIISQTLFQAFKEADTAPRKTLMATHLSRLDFEIVESFLDTDLSALETHLLIKVLLGAYYLPHGQWSSDLYWQYQHPKHTVEKGIFYSPVGIKGVFERRKKDILPMVINNDKFWELPTNLLSIFFGLPDDREALRAYLEE